MASKMRSLLVLVFFFACVFCRSNTKSLTESLGQEVIEIAAPIKELPQDLEEEPSAEIEEDKTTTTTIQPATKRDITRKTNDPSKKIKDIDKIDGRKKSDEEARIEKELADIYKDAIDYKADSAEVTNKEVNVTEIPDKPVERARDEFQFQPESNDPRAVARFRTSIDEISCDRKLSGTTENPESKSLASEDIPPGFLVWSLIYYTIHI